MDKRGGCVDDAWVITLSVGSLRFLVKVFIMNEFTMNEMEVGRQAGRSASSKEDPFPFEPTHI